MVGTMMILLECSTVVHAAGNGPDDTSPLERARNVTLILLSLLGIILLCAVATYILCSIVDNCTANNLNTTIRAMRDALVVASDMMTSLARQRWRGGGGNDDGKSKATKDAQTDVCSEDSSVNNW